MKFKSKAALLGLGLLSSSVFANSYNAEFVYLDADGIDVTGIGATYYFDSVDLGGTAWAEAAFMGRNSGVSAGYIDFDGFADAATISAQFFGDKGNNLYGALTYTNVDTDFGSEDIVTGELGYFFSDNWLVSVLASDESDSPIYLKSKYVSDLGGGSFLNFEASIDDESKDLVANADYYFTPQTSVGVKLSQAEGFDYGLSFNHFFNKSFSLEVNYESTDFGDETGIALVARF